MKRLRSSTDLDSYEKNASKERSQDPNRSSRSSSSSGFYYKPSSASDSNARTKSNLISSSSSSRYDREQSGADEDSGRERMVRKRTEHDFESFDRRKLEFNRYRESGSSSGCLRRSESFRGPRRDFPKGFRSERDRTRGESGSSWQRFGINEHKGSISKVQLREVRDVNSPSWSRDSLVAGRMVGESREREEMRRRSSKSKSRDSGSEQSKSVDDGGGGEVKKSEEKLVETDTSSEMEEGEFDPEPQAKPEHESAIEPQAEPQHESATEPQAEPQYESAAEPRAEPQHELATEPRAEPQHESAIEPHESATEPQAEPQHESSTEPQAEPQHESATETHAEPQHELATEPQTVPQHELATEPQTVPQHELATEPQTVPQHELATEPQAEPRHELASEYGVRSDGKECCHKETENDAGYMHSNVEIEEDVHKERRDERKGEGKVDDELPDCGKSLNGGNSGNGDKIDGVDGEEVEMQEEGVNADVKCEEDSSKGAVVQMSSCLEERCKVDKGIDLERQVEECEAANFIKGVAKENSKHKINIDELEMGLSWNVTDKCKGVAVESANVTDSVENGVWTEREAKDEDLDMERPGTKGFELFSYSPARRVEKEEKSGADKQKEDKLVLESLDLSLSLPNVLLPIGAQHTDAVPGSPTHGRSVQSLTNTFHTTSDDFTASMSFSGSQSFYHNPSCSLNQNSMDNNEQSVHSRPILQGVDQLSQGSWQSQNESRKKDVPMFQRILRNGSGSFSQSSALQGTTNSQAIQTQNIHSFEGSSKAPNGFERQLSFHKQNDVRSTSQSFRSHQNGSFHSYGKKQTPRERHGDSLYRSSSQKEQEQILIGGADFVETILCRMAFEPIHLMARKCHEMTGQSIASLKESTREIMLNAGKHGELRAFQEALQSRSDLTLEMLLKCHRAQLEILAALKTGLPEYLQLDNSVSSSDLAEVFLNLRCRTLTCRSSLPVDECDCKVCSKKNGFCSACMCLVCSKFDMASNTCSWVGCDVCLHWCHADCGLRKAHIRNGHGAAEMQFHCVACDHPSEMFGFVKEVFQNFAKDWTLETFSKELEYVKRIFCGSKDVRGKQLHNLVDQMLVRLATNKLDLPELFSQIMGFLNDGHSFKPGNATVLSGKEQGKGIDTIAGPSQDATHLKSVYSDKAPQLERSSSQLPSFRVDRPDKCSLEPELQRSAEKQLFLPELESFVRIKQEEAKMYQTRADDARKEAEGLKRIAMAKDEKIEEEYRSRVAKLRLAEAEATHKQKFEEFQSLERVYKEYYSMKTRMEADIKDLLLKMEATRRNLGM
ncbi:protein OBERON 4-like isoform X2 [Hibiscus syriacus]|uniref:protein OBERON 4-like isoform X2 n=1 Tax=Hibiscus syriacus TaxID=106335 RepID=UPI001923A516|nr:protein OBERON 4-like isoform X2 [Hibiscus syriacus]